MGFWSRITGRKGMSTLDLFREIYGGRESKAGITVGWQQALEVATVLSCVRVLANGVSQVPFRLYQQANGRRSLANQHTLYPLLYRRPNAWQTSFELRETIMFHLVLTGNAYVWKGMVGRDRALRTLEPVEPHRVAVKRDAESGALTYTITADDGAQRSFPASDIWHLRGPSWSSWLGLDATKLARNSIGLSIATENAHAAMHRNGPRVAGLLSMKDKITPEKFSFLSAWLDKHSADGERAGKPMILDNEAKYTPFGMTGVDAQHLETRKHQIEEICREYGVMPIMVGHADKTATYASAEQMFLAHVVHTLSPWYERIEQSADVNLLTPEERDQGYYTKFTPNALMRGAAKDRADFYAKALGSGGGKGWLSQNDVRDLEDLDPSDDEGANALAQPIGAAPAPVKSENTDGQDGQV